MVDDILLVHLVLVHAGRLTHFSDHVGYIHKEIYQTEREKCHHDAREKRYVRVEGQVNERIDVSNTNDEEGNVRQLYELVHLSGHQAQPKESVQFALNPVVQLWILHTVKQLGVGKLEQNTHQTTQKVYAEGVITGKWYGYGDECRIIKVNVGHIVHSGHRFVELPQESQRGQGWEGECEHENQQQFLAASQNRSHQPYNLSGAYFDVKLVGRVKYFRFQ